jgi:hypothetical protein
MDRDLAFACYAKLQKQVVEISALVLDDRPKPFLISIIEKVINHRGFELYSDTALLREARAVVSKNPTTCPTPKPIR